MIPNPNFFFLCRKTTTTNYSSAVARGGAGGPVPPPQFFSLKVKTDLYKMLKIKYYKATVWEVFKKTPSGLGLQHLRAPPSYITLATALYSRIKTMIVALMPLKLIC